MEIPKLVAGDGDELMSDDFWDWDEIDQK